MSTNPSFWAIDANGDWNNAANWWTYVPETNPPPNYQPWQNVIPGANNDVSLTPTNEPSGTPAGTSPFTLTYNTTDTINSLTGPSYATFALTGGSLTVATTLNLAGPLNVSAGLLDIQNSGGGSSGVGADDANNNYLPGLDLTGGAVEIDAGALVLTGANVLAGGVVQGAGDLLLGVNASLAIDAGADITASTFQLGYGSGSLGNMPVATLNANFSYSGYFLLDHQVEAAGAVFDLNGYTLTLSGTATLSGTIEGPGTLVLTKTETSAISQPYAGFSALGGATIDNQGVANEGEGDDFYLSGTFDNQAGATFNFTADAGIVNQGGASFTNEGTVNDTAGSGTTTITSAFTTTGVLDVATGGTLELDGDGSLAGVVNGGGTLDLLASLSAPETYTLSPGLQLDVANVNVTGGNVDIVLGGDVTYGGDLYVSGFISLETLTLGGHTLTLTGDATFTNGYNPPSNLITAGVIALAAGSTSEIDSTEFTSGVTLNNAGTLTDNGGLILDSDGGSTQSLLDNEAAGTILFNGDGDEIDKAGSSALVENAGKIDKTAGTNTGASNIYVNLISTGTLEVDSGTLALHDGGTLGGTLSGAGAIAVENGQTYTLAAGVKLNVAGLDVYGGGPAATDVVLSSSLSYAGDLTLSAAYSNGATLSLGGYTLTLTGSASFTAAGAANTISSGTVVLAKGSTSKFDNTYIDSAATLENAGTLTDNLNVYLDADGGAAQSLLLNASTGVINIGGDGDAINESGASGLVENQGKIDKTVGTNSSDIYVAVTNTGTLEADTGTLTLHDGGSLGGALTGAGAIALGGGATYTLAAGLKLNVAVLDVLNSGTDVILAQNLTYAGDLSVGGPLNPFSGYPSGETLSLGGHTLTLTGAATFTAGNYTVNTIADGTVTLAKGATGEFDSLDIDSATTFDNAGTLTDNLNVDLDADGGATLSLLFNASTGVIDIGGDGDALNESGSSGLLENEGKIDKTVGTNSSDIYVRVANTGTLEADTGTLTLHDGGNLAGALAGLGAIALEGGAIYTLFTGATATVANLSESGAGTTLTIAEALAYAGAFTQGAGAKLVIGNGDTLTLSETNSLAGATSTGALALTGGQTTFARGATLTTSAWSLTGSGTTATLGTALAYTGAFSAGAGTQLALTGGALTLRGATTLAGVTVTGASPDNLNLFGATSVSALTVAGSAIVANYATATQSGGSITVGDNVSTDRAELYNGAAGVWKIADDSGVARGADAASLIANYGLFEKTGGSATSTINVSVTGTGSIAAQSGTLAFSGPSNNFAGAISGAGTVLFSGGASSLTAGATATVAKLAESGAGTALTIAENLSYAGAFTQGAGAKLIVGAGDTLTLSGTNSLAGSTSGTGALALTGGQTTLSTGATLSTAAWSLTGSGTTATLGTAVGYVGAFSAGAGTQLALTGGALTLRGATTLAGVTLTGASPDNLNLYGATSVSGLTVAGDAIAANYATATQSGGSITVGDSVSTDRAELYNGAAAVWNIADNSGVARGADAASLIVNIGLFEKTGGSATSTISPIVSNSGRILATSGVLDFQAAVSGTGTDTVSGASTLEFDSSVAAGQTIDFTGSGGTLFVGALPTFAATLSGYDVGGAGGSNDIVQLLGSWTETGFSENGAGTLGTLTLSNGTVHESLKFAGDYTSGNFQVNQSGGVTVIS